MGRQSRAERPAVVAGRSGRSLMRDRQSPEASTAIWEAGSIWNRGSH